MNKNKFLVCSLIVIVLLLGCIFLVINKNKKEVPEATTVIEQEEAELEEEEEVQQQEEAFEEEKIVYPKPSYDFTEEEITIEIENLEKEYRIAWVSDLHMINDFQACEDINREYLETLNARYELMFVTKDGTHANELWPEIIKYLNYNEFDAVIFGGDIMDYMSNKNFKYFLKYFEELREDVPWIYLRADHDMGVWYSEGTLLETKSWELHREKISDGDDISRKSLEFDDFVILGINRSTKNMDQYYFDWIKDKLERADNDDKKVIIATHVPFYSKVDDSLEELSMAVRNRVYYWSPNSETYGPNEVTNQFFDMLYDDNTNITNVLAGHLHAKWEGMISDTVLEHIFTPAFEGSIGIINVVPGSK